MSKERTLSIIKPDGIYKNLIGSIISRFEISGLSVIGIKMLKLTRDQAEEFYFEHKNKFYFNDLIDFIISGSIIVQILEGIDAIRCNREIMGATNPIQALFGTIRSDYADSCTKNIVHGSDSLKSAIREIAYFFNADEIHECICNIDES